MKLILGIVWLLMFIWSFIDIISSKKETSWKAIWILVCLIFPIGGVIGYYFIGRKKAQEAVITTPNNQ